MKTNLTLLFLFVTLFGFAQSPVVYDYVTMIQYDDEIRISKNNEKYESINVKAEKEKAYYDFAPLLKRMQDYEKQGWELVTNTIYTTGQGMIPQNYVLMRKKKQS